MAKIVRRPTFAEDVYLDVGFKLIKSCYWAKSRRLNRHLRTKWVKDGK